jgi:hypothetical protein
LTEKAVRINEGQITEYPYKIDEELTIASTHGQWYELNMEDEDLTVWYTLAANTNGASTKGTSLTYAVSPKDAANNYYIYSKGNIFYSGVGHSTVTSDMEAKLFVNTMVAAYRASYEPPEVEVLNSEAVLNSALNYTIEMAQDYDVLASAFGGDNELEMGEYLDGSDVYTVQFTPIDYNVRSTKLECTISYVYSDDTLPPDSIRYIDTVIDEDGNEHHADPTTHKFTDLANGQTYTFEYPKQYLYDWSDGITNYPMMRKIKFSVNNNLSASVTVTTLNMSIQPLLQLD